MRIYRSLVIVMLIGLVMTLAGTVPVTYAQTGDVATLASWVALTVPAGHEDRIAQQLADQLTGWTLDRHGNLVKTTGQGQPRRIVACGLDWLSFAVSQITADGYLRLHRIGPGSGHPLWDQAHEGQHVRILTRSGPLVGVTAIANGHFAAQHANETAIVSADDLWVDVGATSAAEVQAMGVDILDPVVRDLPAWSYASEVAGPGAGSRVGCAAVVAAAEAGEGIGQTTWVLSARHTFGWVGLGAVLTDLSPVDELVVLGRGEESRVDEQKPSISARLDAALQASGASSAWYLAPRVDGAGALMERVELTESEVLLDALLRAVGEPSPAGRPAWIAAPDIPSPLNSNADRLAAGTDGAQLEAAAAVLGRLAETPAVPGHEGPVRQIVLDEMPDWARALAQVDDLGNVWVDMGPPNGDATVFMAHMDEVGWEIEAVDPSGEVRLRSLGGVVTPAWEGQPARVQLDSGVGAESVATVQELLGVFLTRSEPTQKTPESVSAWFGMTGEELLAAGVRPGMGVTGHKMGHRLGRFRYAARSMDDRAGSTALLLALKTIDPTVLTHRVIFAWSV